MSALILNQQQVASLLTIEDAVEAVKAGYMAFNQGKVILPPIVSIEVEKYHGEMDFKIGYSLQEDIIGIKMAGGYWDNPKNYNLPSGVATICLIDAKNGVPVSILDGTLITAFRTGAAGAIGAMALARKDSKKVGVIGTGSQARMQVRALVKYFAIEEVKVFGIEGKEEYVEEMSALLPHVHFVAAKDAKEAVEDADIIVTVTASHSALVMDEWVKPGTHINAIGCDMQGKQELDPLIFKRAKIVHDSSMESCRRGDTQHAINAGFLTADDIHGEIGELLLGEKEGRTSDDEITIFDATGLSIQDINSSLFVYRKALALNIGSLTEII